MIRETIITRLSEILATEQDRPTIFKTITQALDESFELENIDVIIAVRDNDRQLSHYTLLEKDSPHTRQMLSLDHPVIDYMQKQHDPVFLSDSPSNVQTFLTAQGYRELKKCLALPFSSPEMLEGIIIVGERSIGMSFKDIDIRFFKRLINYVAAILYRLTPFDVLEKQYFAAKQQLHEAEIQLIRAQKIEAIAPCHAPMPP